MTDSGPYYSDTMDPFASPREAKGSVWAVFVVGQNAPVCGNLTEVDADAEVKRLGGSRGSVA